MSELDVCSFAAETCLVCGQGDSAEEFGPEMILICSSCSFRCIHVGCEEKRTQTHISEATALDPENLWFCSPECESVHRKFEPLVRSTVLPQANRTIEVVGTSGRKRGDSMQADAALRILRGSFEPLIMENDRCLIDMVVNSYVTPIEEETEEDAGHDYSGFRTLILREGKTIVCAATVRVFGTLFAEIPFVGTHPEFRKQGALRMLFAAIETVLTELKVTQILIPSIRSLKRMWCQNFYFERMTLDEVAKVEDHIVFPDQDSCILLRKQLGKEIAPLRVGPSAAVSGKNKAEENRKTRRAAVKARKAMVPDDQVDGDSSDSSEDSDESPDVHISTSDEEGTENGDAEEVAAEQECLEQVPKAVERGRSKQTEAKATTDPGVEQSSESMKLKALRAVIDSGALSISMKSVQQITTRKTAHRKRRLFKAPKFSYDEKLKILMSQVARSEATAREFWQQAQV